MPIRNLVLVLGDQLDPRSAAFDGFDKNADAVMMAEVEEEAAYIRQHKIRLAIFFSAMRHFGQELEEKGIRVHYRRIEDQDNQGSFAKELEERVRSLHPEKIIVLHPGDYRVLESLRATAKKLTAPLEVREDNHFYCGIDEFREYAERGRRMILENFYRKMRQKHGILMDHGKPAGDQWNFDKDNRRALTAEGRKQIRPPHPFAPDAITKEVIEMVERRFPKSPGKLEKFDYPVTRIQARAALKDFIAHRLPLFGPYEDAMAAGEPYLFHSRLSSSMNLHLLHPRDAVDAAVAAYNDGKSELNSVEGFVRQVLGWREYVHGIYWEHMPGYQEMNALDAQSSVPAFFWTAGTEMNCVRNAVSGLIDHAYTHHIQRLMVLGLYALVLGAVPRKFHEWHMSMYVDAIDWVSLPNALGMSQFGDGGIMGTKPYCASGSYINRMSDYCKGCRYKPTKATGDQACPFTTLYWDFLARNRELLARNGRMLFQIQNLDRHDKSELVQIRRRAETLRTL